jgi:hypothetical protein
MNSVSSLPALLELRTYTSLVIGSVCHTLILQRDLKLTALVALAQASLWSVINLGVAILCACLPTYRPLLLKVGDLSSSFKSTHMRSSCADVSAAKSDLSSANSGNYSTGSGYYRKMDDSTSDAVPLTKVTGGERRDARFTGMPFDGIHVQRDVEVV